MLTFSTLILFVPAAALVAASPGANNLLSLGNGMRSGFAPTALSLSGRLAAFAILLALVIAGLGAVVAASEVAFTVIKWVGVGYLAFLGVKTWRARVVSHGPVKAGTPMSLARKEFAVAITNPKAMLLFTAFIPQFVDMSGSVASQLVALGALYLVIEFAMACGYALAGALLRRFELTAARQRLMNRISGGMMLGAAGLLATTAQRS
ncbi:LysE family translocator [Acuticoccus mangrovi]|uniref:LysE family translocator n=1 Tax=Acuticoccus mangrovi TaxID=2796142 RepID=A0A934IUE3_9HYPH|nr:LysE family translocator [Acuticoccus mangrovi]MBJ3777909.1 LysE family translocator [Acuticoccus mangrovi]